MKKLTALMVLGALTTLADADFVFYTSAQPLAGLENVNFNVPGLINSGTLVQGQLNDSGDVYDFLSTEDLTTPATGVLRVEAADGAFTLLDIRPNTGVFSFTGIVFDINAAADGDVFFSVTDGNGDVETFNDFDVFGAGSNPFTIEAVNGDVITRVVITTSSSFTDFRGLKVAGSNAVPEPSSMAALALGALLLKRRRARRL